MKTDFSLDDYSRLMMDNMADGLYCRHFSAAGGKTYVYFNSTVKALFENDDVTSSKYWNQQKDDEHDDELSGNQTQHRYEYPMIDEDGTEKRRVVFLKRKVSGTNGNGGFNIITSVVDVSEGGILKDAGIRQEIREIALLNQELEAKDRLKDIIVNNLKSTILLLTKDCQIVWTNKYASTTLQLFFGLKNYATGDYCDYRVNGKCTKPDGECFIKAVLQAKHELSAEGQCAKDTYLELTVIPILDKSGEPQQVLLIASDISQTKNMLIEVQQSKAKVDSALTLVTSMMNNLPNSIFILDPDDGYRFTNVNDAFCEQMNLKRSEIIGKTPRDILDEKEADKNEVYDHMLAEQNSGMVSYEISTILNNQERFFMINKTIMNLNGERLILSISTDISYIKKLNKEMEVAKNEAQRADKLKSAFLANMSHEIRTPLNAIVGFSDLITDSTDDEEKKEYCKIINNNSQILLQLIGEILDMSMIESGVSEFNRSLVDVSPFFDEYTSKLASLVTNKDVKFIVNNPYKSCLINLDKLRLGQVITQFVTNAVKYTRKGYVKVGYYVENNGLTIKVEDTGIGISADKRNMVFERFEKMDSMVQGIGLGLSVAKIITEVGGGKVWFESEEGKGSTFYSWKPFDDIKVVEADPLHSNGVASKCLDTKRNDERNSDKKILVVEDNESSCAFLKKILTGYDITLVKNGIEAVGMVATKSFDLVLMNINMPIMDGIDATRQIRKFNQEVPIVAMTANAYAFDEKEALFAGCNDFLAKPILPEDLMDVISKL